MELGLSDTERALVSRWRALTGDVSPSAKTAWTRQGWIPRRINTHSSTQAADIHAWCGFSQRRNRSGIHQNTRIQDRFVLRKRISANPEAARTSEYRSGKGSVRLPRC